MRRCLLISVLLICIVSSWASAAPAAAAPALVTAEFGLADPGSLAVDQQPFVTRLVLTNRFNQPLRLRIALDVSHSADLPARTVVQAQVEDVVLEAGQGRTYRFNHRLAAQVYQAVLTITHLPDGQQLSRQTLNLPVFPRPAAAPTKGLRVLSSALSPFVIVQSSNSRIVLFADAEKDKTCPTHLVFDDDHKVRNVPLNQPIDLANMSESWMIFHRQGSPSANEKVPYPIDIPVLVVLQNMPQTIKSAQGGIEMTFATEAGSIAMVPLYGASLVPATQTAQWAAGLPADVATRCRLLAEISREYPIKVNEQFKASPAQDKLLVRDTFEYLSIDDQWATPHRKLAPLEYLIALAHRSNARLLSVTGKVLDLDMAVGDGLWAGVEGEQVSYTLTGLLRYINTVEKPKLAPADHPLLADALKHSGVGSHHADPSLQAAASYARLLSSTRSGDRPAMAAAMKKSLSDVVASDRLSCQFDSTRQQMCVNVQPSLNVTPSYPFLAPTSQSMRCLYQVAVADLAAARPYLPLHRGMYNSCLMTQRWGDSGLESDSPWVFDSALDAIIGFARMNYWAADDLAYRSASYHAAKRLLALYTVGTAYPRWVKEKNLWGTVADLQLRYEGGQVAIYDVTDAAKPQRFELQELTFITQRPGNSGIALGRSRSPSDPGDAELRFIKDRLGDYAKTHLRLSSVAAQDIVANLPIGQRSDGLRSYWEKQGGIAGHELEIILAGVAQEYAPLWQGQPSPPKIDNVFRQGIGYDATLPPSVRQSSRQPSQGDGARLDWQSLGNRQGFLPPCNITARPAAAN